MRPSWGLVGVIALGFVAACGSGDSSGGGKPGEGPGTCDADQAQNALFDATGEPSCVLACDQCPDETTTPWTCSALGKWSSLAHDCSDSACGKWDATYPEPQQGKCTASEPSGAAVAKTSPTDKPVVLPDGRRLQPAGVERVLDDANLQGTFPASALWLPGTHLLAVSDNGYADHALRILDADKLAANQDPIVSEVPFTSPDSLNYGLALAADGTLYAASGAPDSVIRAFTVDATSGKITRDATRDIAVENAKAGDVFPAGIAISPDGTRLAVAQAQQHVLLVYSLDAGDYATKLAAVDLGGKGAELLATRFDPASSDVVYVTAWNGARLFEVDLADLATPAIREIPTGQQPEQIAFISASHLVVSNSQSDSLSVVDRASAKVDATIPVDANDTLHGEAPSALAWDAATSRLYVTLAGANGVAVFHVTDNGAGAAPTFDAKGVLPTGWWPTAVLVPDVPPTDALANSLVVLAGRGHGIGPETIPQGFASGVNGSRMKGSAQIIDKIDDATVAAATSDWQATGDVAGLDGRPTVSCPDGADYDFPVPATNDNGPSALLKHIVFIVRENKTFDAIMGDVPGLDGDPKLVMAPGKMDQVWGNIRKIAHDFSHADNFYEDAEQSIQGHYWTVNGRSSDFIERTWLSIWGRHTRPLPESASADVRPEEGGLFKWLDDNQVAYDNMGELYGAGVQDPGYGIVNTSGTQADTKGACYVAARARELCDMKPFTYVWLVNDHTLGAQAGSPNPGLMIAVNDEATGMIVDGISHSPMWKDTLIVVVEDDPSDGADHVDAHRSIAVFASPWVKRDYVSKTHFDISSVHKLFAHILGIPYHNRAVAHAALPLDLFTSTPDYTPYDYLPRTYTDVSCNPQGTQNALEAQGWDFSEPDDQPGLDAQVWRMLHDNSGAD